MKQFIAILVFVASFIMQSHAQSFLNDLKQSKQGEGTVTVEQSADIDNLVNAKLKASNTQATPQSSKPVAQNVSDKRNVVNGIKKEESHVTAQHNITENVHRQVTAERQQTVVEHKSTIVEHKSIAAEHKTASAEKQHALKNTEKDVAPNLPVVDTSKKFKSR